MRNFIQQLLQQAMKKKGGDLIAPVLNRSVGKLGPRDLVSPTFRTNPLRNFPGVPLQAPGLPKPPVKAPRGISPYAVSGAVVGGGTVLGGALAATNQIEGALNQVGPAVDRFFGRITPQAIQQWGREQEEKGWGGALEMATPFGFLAAPFIPNTPAAKPRMPGLPVDYKQTELEAGAAAERFRPGAGFPGQQSAAGRAYQQEKSRVEQLTAQDPELQRYEAARLKAVAPGATEQQIQSAEDIGMQIWQQKYGNTPMGQPGGAVGRFNPLMDRTFGYQSGGAPGQQLGVPTLGPSPLVPQVDPSLNPAGPNYIGGEGPPLMNFADPRLENVSPEEFQRLLNQVSKK